MRYIPLNSIGLAGAFTQQAPSFYDGTINLYIDSDGYLRNYPGSTDIFIRGELGSERGTPPSTDVEITRMAYFIDAYGKEHTVFVLKGVGSSNGTLCETVGNGYRELYKFSGELYNGKCMPSMFMHAGKLIIANPGDSVVVFDGINGVQPLGVIESPAPPVADSTPAPYMDQNSYTGVSSWGMRNTWWQGLRPTNGPASNFAADGTTPAYGFYRVVQRFVDMYGNRGPISPPSAKVSVPPQYNETGATTYKNGATEFLVVDVSPPLDSIHIYTTQVGRSLSINSDGGAGAEGLYYREKTLQATEGRATLMLTDGNLALLPVMDDCHAPPPSYCGASWKNRVWLASSADRVTVYYSDIAAFGEFTTTRFVRSKTPVTAIVPIGDRLAIFGENSCIVLFQDNTGNIGILDEFTFGSRHGRSIAAFGPQCIGIIDGRFAVFDGQVVTYLDAPYYIEGDYIDFKNNGMSALLTSEYYMLACRRGYDTDDNNVVVMMHLKTRTFHMVEEPAYDLLVRKGEVLCCKQSIAKMFLGYYEKSAAFVMNIPVEQPGLYKSVINVMLHIQPSSNKEANISVSDDDSSTGTFSFKMIGSPAAAFGNYAVWNDNNQYPQKWSSPGDVFVDAKMTGRAGDSVNRFEIKFPTGARIRIKGMLVQESEFARVL